MPVTYAENRHMLSTADLFRAEMARRYPRIPSPVDTLVLWLTDLVNAHRVQHRLVPVGEQAVARIEASATGADYQHKLTLRAARLACGLADDDGI